MCGILGASGHTLDDDQFRRGLRAIAHRGPDADGVYHIDRLWLGHRRLAIIDLSSAANQPMSKLGLVLSFNGEIYNYRQLRRELEGLGSSFTTDSDTEVILEGWRVWGTGVLARLRGMFAFAMYEERTRRLFLARDRFGIKPLFVWYEPDVRRIAFASELKALPALGLRPTISDKAVTSLLLYDWIPEEYCIYSEVTKLPPGAVGTFDSDGTYKIESYWNPRDLPEASDTVTTDVLADAMSNSVEAHLIADVEIGSFLSGGLDSSLITAIAASKNRDIRCYTIGFRDSDRKLEAGSDDLSYSRQLAKRLGVRLQELEIAPNAYSQLDRITRILDEPLGDAAALNVLLLCEAARDAGLKVMLSGMGADEIFSGYRRHFGCLVASHYRRFPLLARNLVDSLIAKLPVATNRRGLQGVRWAKRFLSFANADEETAYRRSYTYYSSDELKEFRRDSASVDELCRHHRDVYWESARANTTTDQLRRMFLTDLHFFLPALNLAYTDRASMAASVEVRVPFVDAEVVDVGARMKSSDRIRGRVQKYLLRKVAERWLPKSIIYRPKASFGAPLRAWTTRDLREPIRDMLPNGRIVTDGFVDREYLSSMISRNESGQSDHAQAIWQLLSLEHWLRQQAGDSAR